MDPRWTGECVDRDSHVPPYLQIRQRLLAEAAIWPDPAVRFYSEEAAAARYGVSRMTARRALAELAADGVLRRVKGLGSFVQPAARLTEAFTPTMDPAREWRALGYAVATRVLNFECVRPAANVLRRLELTPKARVLFVRRVRLVATIPVALDARFIRLSVMRGAGMTRADAEGSILQALWRAGPLTKGEWDIEARLADGDEAALLGVPAGSAVLIRTLAYTSADGKIAAVGQTVNRADRMRYAVRLPLRSAAESFGAAVIQQVASAS